MLINREEFLSKYNCENAFVQSGLSWDELVRIYEDYSSSERMTSLGKKKDDLIRYLMDGNTGVPIHSISGRVKDAEHLIEKIIRKRGVDRSAKYDGIQVSNYLDIIRDIIGIRILTLQKENWFITYDLVKQKFTKQPDMNYSIVETPVAYTRYGDRNIYQGRDIHQEHTNKGYRSQHYIVKFEGVYCEIQARTIAEEVHGEFDHKVKYPYKESNRFLRRYSSIVSQHLDAVDEMISTCLQISDRYLPELDKEFDNDDYIDWQNVTQPIRYSDDANHRRSIMRSRLIDSSGNVDISRYIEHKLLRRGEYRDEPSEKNRRGSN